MDLVSQQPKERDNALSLLNVAIEGLNLAKEVSAITPAKAVFGSVSALLTMIRVRFFLFCGDELSAHVSRTQWLTNQLTLSSGYSVLEYAESSTKG